MNAEERKERSTKLQAAIEEYLEGQGFEGVLGDWILVGSVVRIDSDGDPNCEYFIGFAGGSMLQHPAIGLMTKGMELLTSGDVDG